MRAVFGLVLVIGMGLAGFAVYMAKGYFEQQNFALEQQRAAAAAIVPTIEVVAVNRVVEYGQEITADDIHVIRYVEATVPEGAFTTQEALFPLGNDVVRVATRQMEPNEPILAAKVTAPGEIVGITSLLSPGMRAFTIQVDATSGVSGFLRPRDFVDVYWTGRGGYEGGEDMTQLIETRMRIIAVDQSAEMGNAEATIARTVTVEADPRQVAALAQAQSSGRLSLALVGANDQLASVEGIAINQASLLGITQVAPVEVQEEQVCTITAMRGTEEIVTEIPCTN